MDFAHVFLGHLLNISDSSKPRGLRKQLTINHDADPLHRQQCAALAKRIRRDAICDPPGVVKEQRVVPRSRCRGGLQKLIKLGV